MSYEFLKVIVQPVILERNESGEIVSEQLGQPTSLYNREALNEFMDSIELQIHNENVGKKGVEANGSRGSQDDEHHVRQPELPRSS